MRPRIKAFAIHLAASAVLALMCVAVVFGVWYPSPLHKAVSVGEIFFLLLVVDVTIGPLLTFLVYKPGKKSLRFDLTCIVLLQLCAFFYGIWTVAEGRPVWLVFNADRFDLVQAYEIDGRNLGQAESRYRAPGWLGPEWVSARMPEGSERRNAITMESIFSGIDIAQRPELYMPLVEAAQEIRKRAHPLDELSLYNASELVSAALQPWPGADAFLPMMARAHPVTVLINKDSARVIAVVDLSPWK